jgi:hypothetical protein
VDRLESEMASDQMQNETAAVALDQNTKMCIFFIKLK